MTSFEDFWEAEAGFRRLEGWVAEDTAEGVFTVGGKVVKLFAVLSLSTFCLLEDRPEL